MTGETSIRLRRAKDGDRESLAWLIEHLSPLLLAQARYRLAGRLRNVCDPEDLVQDAWAVALPRLNELRARAGRETPVLVRFLATTLLQLANNLARRRTRRGETEEIDDAPAWQTGLVTRVARGEMQTEVLRCLESLEPIHREVLVLRDIEQLDVKDAALLLGISPNAVAQRHRRARAKLRESLPASIFDDLSTEPPAE